MEKEITVAISTNSLPFASFHPPAYYSIENANRGDWWNARDHWQQQFCTSPHSSVVFAPLKRAPSLQITLRNCPLLSSPSLSEWGQQWMQFLHLSLSLSLFFSGALLRINARRNRSGRVGTDYTLLRWRYCLPEARQSCFHCLEKYVVVVRS